MAHMVTHDGRPVAYVKDENAASVFILKNQGMSTDWAMKYEGWGYGPAPEAPDNTTHHLRSIGAADKPRGVKCDYCGKARWQLVADIGDEDVTQYQCPKAEAK